MDDKFPSSLILLTYKNKALLMYKQDSPIDDVKHAWSFIVASKKERESFENVLIRSVHKELGIKIKDVEYVSQSFYHANLTDDNVNQIKRAEGQLLDFFALKDLQRLLLSHKTREFVSKHGGLITASI